MLLNIEKIKVLWGKLLHQEASPNQVASSFAIGFFVSFLPIIPFQTILTLFLAYLLRANKVACLVGLHAHLVVLPFIPFIFVAEYNIGTDLLGFRHPHYMDPERINLFRFTLPHDLVHSSWKYLRATLVGSLVLGAPLSLLSFFMVRQTAIRWQQSRNNIRGRSGPKTGKTDIKN